VSRAQEEHKDDAIGSFGLFTCMSCKWVNHYGECRKWHTQLEQCTANACKDYGFREE